MKRKKTSNEVVCDEFRNLLSRGFYIVDEDGILLEGDELGMMLTATKPWRNELWKAFRDLEDRLCPVKAFEEGRG